MIQKKVVAVTLGLLAVLVVLVGFAAAMPVEKAEACSFILGVSAVPDCSGVVVTATQNNPGSGWEASGMNAPGHVSGAPGQTISGTVTGTWTHYSMQCPPGSEAHGSGCRVKICDLYLLGICWQSHYENVDKVKTADDTHTEHKPYSATVSVCEVPGCTDPEALNYNPEATVDDGSCKYPPPPVPGCTDPKATNYNPEATVDDGSCRYPDYSFGTEVTCDYADQVISIDGVASYFGDRHFWAPDETSFTFPVQQVDLGNGTQVTSPGATVTRPADCQIDPCLQDPAKCVTPVVTPTPPPGCTVITCQPGAVRGQQWDCKTPQAKDPKAVFDGKDWVCNMWKCSPDDIVTEYTVYNPPPEGAYNVSYDEAGQMICPVSPSEGSPKTGAADLLAELWAAISNAVRQFFGLK